MSPRRPFPSRYLKRPLSWTIAGLKIVTFRRELGVSGHFGPAKKVSIILAKGPTIFVYIATAVVLLNVLAGGKGSRRRNQKLMINIVGFFSRYTYHSLLVVQGSISIAYWSSQPSVPQHTTTPPGPPLLRRCVFLLGLATFGSVRSYIFDYTARRAIA